MKNDSIVPIDTQPLFRPLDTLLIELLASLSPEDWDKQTVASQWKVKDVAAHLLDGNLRCLSMQRDKYFGDAPPEIKEYTDLVNWLNQLNADWVSAMQRLSPTVLTLLHQFSGPLVSGYYESLDPFGEAIFAVDWAGETKSYNWMHLAREYTEKWHHQQQIRDAIGKEGIMTKTYFAPLMDTFFRAMPHTFKHIAAPTGTLIHTLISPEIAGEWFLEKKENGWELVSEPFRTAETQVFIPAHIAWKLFSKNIRPADVLNDVRIAGNQELGFRVLEMVAVMA
jgi:hypothetical protein